MPQTYRYLVSPTLPAPTEGKRREAGESRTHPPRASPLWKPTSSSHLEEMGAPLHEEAYITDQYPGTTANKDKHYARRVGA
jgi:hypothetical protein